jgi:hypothetical protein
MRANLTSRLRRLETRQISVSEPRPTVQFADLEPLPRNYVGQRHLVQIDRPGSERPALRRASWARPGYRNRSQHHRGVLRAEPERIAGYCMSTSFRLQMPAYEVVG